MKNLSLVILCLTLFSCNSGTVNSELEKTAINNVLDSWHAAAGKASFDDYFQYMTDDGIYIGTDATENWNKSEFMVWSKPYFDKGKAWNFTALERNIYFDKSGKIAWFDELLNTQMKICRGSGVMVKDEQDWKIKHYVLSMTFPNDLVDTIIGIKTPIEDSLILELEKKSSVK